MSKQINVSEIFHSIQGEGSTQGKPSVFVRLQACNLMCGGQGTEKDGELHGGATWRCDTIEVWLEGEGWTVEKLSDHLFKKYGGKFLNNSQIVITGGEPMLQQEAINELIPRLQSNLSKELRVEVETNGTLLPSSTTQMNVNQFNVSPKLSNSGMPKKRRINSESLNTLAKLAWKEEAIFKFVVTREADLREIIDDYFEPFEIPTSQIWLMPGCTNQQQFQQTAPLVADLCKSYGFHFSSRMQINLWNETTGV